MKRQTQPSGGRHLGMMSSAQRGMVAISQGWAQETSIPVVLRPLTVTHSFNPISVLVALHWASRMVSNPKGALGEYQESYLCRLPNRCFRDFGSTRVTPWQIARLLQLHGSIEAALFRRYPDAPCLVKSVATAAGLRAGRYPALVKIGASRAPADFRARYHAWVSVPGAVLEMGSVGESNYQVMSQVPRSRGSRSD